MANRTEKAIRPVPSGRARTRRPGASGAEGSVAETRERILRAALAAFSQLGFDGATTRDIASRAGVPLGLLQYHFGGKPKLWRAAVERAFAELREGLDGLIAEAARGGPRVQLRSLIQAHVAFVAANPEFVRLMHDEGKRGGPRMRWMVDRFVKPLFDSVRPIVESYQQIGHLPGDVDPLHFVYALVGAVDAIFHQAEECKRVSGIDPTEPAAVAAHTRAIEFLFLGGVAPPSDEGEIA